MIQKNRMNLQFQLGQRLWPYNYANGRSVWDLVSESEGSQDVHNSDEDCCASDSDMGFDKSAAADSNVLSNRGKLVCLDCSDVFETKKAFRVHIASHEGYRRFKCDVCDQRFRKSENLNDHTRTHTGERPFKCDFCKKHFINLGHLIRHKRIHTGERPFKCNVCERSFSDSSNLQQHLRVHRGWYESLRRGLKGDCIITDRS